MEQQRYGARVEQSQGVAVYILTDANAPAEVRAVPSLGNNCIGFRTSAHGASYEVLSTPPSLEELRKAGSHWGIPVLFPFPNRIRHGSFSFQGKVYNLHDESSHGNAIHGLLMRRSWRVVSHGADVSSAWLEAVGSTDDLPDILERWPWPFTCSLTYRLRDGILYVETRAQNTGTSAMPMGFGLHPYFNAPLAPGSSKADCDAQVPADARWVLDEHLVPTGAIEPVSAGRDIRQFRSLDDVTFDDVFTQLHAEDGWTTCRLRDRKAGVVLEVRSDAAFREIVVFTPPWHPAICFEPYTCTSDAFNLAARGIDSGMVTLEPGQHWQGTVILELKATE